MNIQWLSKASQPRLLFENLYCSILKLRTLENSSFCRHKILLFSMFNLFSDRISVSKGKKTFILCIFKIIQPGTKELYSDSYLTEAACATMTYQKK